jgi:hypothetical protein
MREQERCANCKKPFKKTIAWPNTKFCSHECMRAKFGIILEPGPRRKKRKP